MIICKEHRQALRRQHAESRRIERPLFPAISQIVSVPDQSRRQWGEQYLRRLGDCGCLSTMHLRRRCTILMGLFDVTSGLMRQNWMTKSIGFARSGKLRDACPYRLDKSRVAAAEAHVFGARMKLGLRGRGERIRGRPRRTSLPLLRGRHGLVICEGISRW